MTKPLSNKNIPGSNRDNTCPKISSACIIWHGPDIPCIELCNGDAIDDVTYKLATKLCEVLSFVNISTVDFSCITEDSPENMAEVLQLLINKVCDVPALPTPPPSNVNQKVSNPNIALPPCLFYEEEGEQITFLPHQQYSQFLALNICDIYSELSSYQNQINNLNTRVTNVESFITNFVNISPSIQVFSGCASSNNPGEIIPISQAFQNFEQHYCNFINVVGDQASLVTAISRQCFGLSTEQQLSANGQMLDIPGWVITPNTLAQSINNLWLTICDMRAAVSEIVTNNSVPCILAPIENLQVTPTTLYGVVQWTPSSIVGIQAPIAYRIEVYEWDGSAPTGSVLFTQVYDDTTTLANITSTDFGADRDYVVYVTAIYSCGEAPSVSFVGKILVETVLYLVSVDTTEDEDSIVNCIEDGSPVAYDQINRLIEVKILDAVTSDPYLVPVDTFVTVRFEIISCEFESPVYEDVTYVIQAGEYNVILSYVASTYVNCGNPTCSVRTKNVHCGMSITNPNAEFLNIIPIC